MARSKWKLCSFERGVWRRIRRVFNKKKRIKIKSFIFDRKSTIPRIYSYRVAIIHKGHKFRKLILDPLKVGYKFGEFSFTRKPFYYPTKKTNKKNNILIRR